MSIRRISESDIPNKQNKRSHEHKNETREHTEHTEAFKRQYAEKGKDKTHHGLEGAIWSRFGWSRPTAACGPGR